MSVNDKLEESLGISTELADVLDTSLDTEMEGEVNTPIVHELDIKDRDTKVTPLTDISSDYIFARNVIYTLIEETTALLGGAIQAAKLSEHPRSYSVVNEMLQTARSLTGDLLELQSTYKKVIKDTPDDPDIIPSDSSEENTSVYRGSTADLSQFLEEEKKKQEESSIVGVVENTD